MNTTNAPHRVLSRQFHGVWSPNLTPVNVDLSPDSVLYVEQIQYLLENGCHGVAPFGTTGEATSFSVKERMNMLEAAVANGINPDRMIPGTGCCALTDTVDLSRHALEVGCKAVMMLPPFYYKNLSDEALFRAYATTIEEIDHPKLRIVLYHIPPMSQIPITHEVIRRLIQEFSGVVVGLKDSSGDMDGTRAFIEAFPELDIFPGSEFFLLEGLRAGGVGCITATANVNPMAIRELFDAFVTGQEGLDAVQDTLSSYRNQLQKFPVIPLMKRMIAEKQTQPNWAITRPPFVNLADEHWREFRELFPAG